MLAQPTPGKASPTLSPRSKPGSADTAEPVLHTDSSLVLIPVHVTRADGAPITNLQKSHFRVTENDVEQIITHFSQDDAPVSVGLLLDISGSMRPKMAKAVEAAEAFFRTSNPQDEFSLIEFSDSAKLCIPFTVDVNDVTDRIERTRPFGRTALLDAVHLCLRSMKQARHERKAIVIVSDGGDNWSRHSAREIKNELLESDVQVYAMGIYGLDTGKSTAEEKNGPQLLDELAEQSGGRHYRVDNLKDLPAISARIGNELRNEYLIGYYPNPCPHNGKYHPVQVKVNDPDLTVQLRTSYRRGYYAPVP